MSKKISEINKKDHKLSDDTQPQKLDESEVLGMARSK